MSPLPCYHNGLCSPSSYHSAGPHLQYASLGVIFFVFHFLVRRFFSHFGISVSTASRRKVRYSAVHATLERTIENMLLCPSFLKRSGRRQQVT